MQEINIPQELLDEYIKAGDQESAWRNTERKAFEEIKELNKVFIRACRERINRKLRKISHGLDIRFYHCGDEVWIDAELVVYLHGQNAAHLICRLKKTNDSDAMCELAKKIHALRKD